MLHLITVFIIGVAVVNLIRMMVYLVGADLYTIRRALADKGVSYRPTVSLVVPAHNEAAVIEATLACLLKLDYAPLQIILADDGSTDDTVDRIYAYKRAHDTNDVLQVFTQPNGGKADALNNAIRAMASGELVMCLDGDSIIAPDAVTKSVAYFRDPRVVATASNVNILPNGTLLGLVQRYEYLISYHMKKAQNRFNVEYIIGGIGSMFRRSVLDEVGLYDTNTMTEDIDLTLKIISHKGNRKQRIAYAHDAITYTEAVPSFRSLVRQRYRWKYGRLQAFYKNYRLFFSRDTKHSVGLSWFFLPYALWQEVMYLIEPAIVTVVIAVSIYYRSPWTLVSAMIIVSSYVIANILGTIHLPRRDKALLSLMAPLMYVFLYVLSVVEYIALLHAIVRLPRLRQSISGEQVTWASPERTGQLKGGRHRVGHHRRRQHRQPQHCRQPGQVFPQGQGAALSGRPVLLRRPGQEGRAARHRRDLHPAQLGAQRRPPRARGPQREVRLHPGVRIRQGLSGAGNAASYETFQKRMSGV